MADLVTRLRLDDKQFNDNIRRSKQQMQQLEQMGKTVGNAFKSFSVILIGVQTAMDAFNKAVTASKGINDLYEESMRAATTSVNEFFYSITTGDFTFLSQGLGDIIEKAKQAQKAITDLANTKISFGYFDSKWSSALEDAINRAKDLSLTEEERNKAIEEAKGLVANLEGGVKQVQQALKNTIKTSLTEGTLLNAEDISLDDFEKILEINLKVKGSDTYKNELESQYATYKKMVGYATQGKSVSIDGVYYKGAEAVKLLNARYKDSILYNEMLKDMSKDELQNVVNLAMEYQSLSKKVVEYKNKLLELTNPLANEDGNNNVGEVKLVIPNNSIAEIEKKIQETKANLNVAIDNESRIKLYNELKELEEKKRIIEFKYKYPNAPSGEIKSPSLASIANVPDFKSLKINKIADSNNNKAKEGININEQYVDSINAVSNALGALSQVQDANAASMLSWVGSVMTATALAIQEIKKLVAAKTAEGAAAAGAEAAKTPFVGWLLVGGAIATALAAFASIPSFNDGGIFQSPFTTGDKNLARLNGR